LKACCDSDLVDSAAEIFFTMEKKIRCQTKQLSV